MSFYMRRAGRGPAAIAVVMSLATGLTGLSMSYANHGSVALASTVGSSIASIAEGQEGVQDSPSNTYCNPFSGYWGDGSASGCATGNRNVEWCADFAAWAWRQAGATFTYGYGAGDINAGAKSFYNWAVANGAWHAAGSGYTPRPGDVAVYGTSGANASHVGVVVSNGSNGPNVVNGDWEKDYPNDFPTAVVYVANETNSDGTSADGALVGYASPVGGGTGGTSGYESTFQANTGYLYVYGGIANANLQQGMASGTSPSVAVLSNGGYETAFQANTGNLFVYGNGGSKDTGQGMMPGTSPSIAASPSGGFRVAFEANTGNLYTYDSSTGAANLQQGMDRASSPAIAALPSGGYEEAFQANTHNLYVYGSGGSANTQQGMLPGSSPSIAASSNGGFKVAFDANIGSLYTYTSGSGAANLQQGMDQTSSPVIAALAGGGYEEAFQSNTHNLIVIGSGGNTNTGQGMMPGTSPSIAGSPSGGFQADFQANTGNLYTYTSGSGAANLQQGMMATTSPCVSSSLGGGCAPGLPHYGLSVSVDGTGSGAVTGSGISCPGTCANLFTYGQSVPLTANPSSGSKFTGWSGACSGTGSCAVPIVGTQSVIATFTQHTVSLPTKGKVVVTLSHDAKPVNGEWICLAHHKKSTVTTHRTSAGECEKTVKGKATLKSVKPGTWHVLRLHGSHRSLSKATVKIVAGHTSRFTWKV